MVYRTSGPRTEQYYLVRSVDEDRHSAVLFEETSGQTIGAEWMACTPITSVFVRFRPGDRFCGVVHDGLAVGHVTRAPVPEHVVTLVEAVLKELLRLGMRIATDPHDLAAGVWASNGPLSSSNDVLRGQVLHALVRMPGGHPDLDSTYIESFTERLTERMTPHVPGFAIRGVGDPADEDKRGHFELDPDGLRAPYAEYDYERPQELVVPLIGALNVQLAAHGATYRWVTLPSGRWVLLRPELREYLVVAGLVDTHTM